MLVVRRPFAGAVGAEKPWRGEEKEKGR